MGDCFNCGRGIRLGDPLSSLLFCLVEEVHSRGISQLTYSYKILPMIGPKGKYFPTVYFILMKYLFSVGSIGNL